MHANCAEFRNWVIPYPLTILHPTNKNVFFNFQIIVTTSSVFSPIVFAKTQMFGAFIGLECESVLVLLFIFLQLNEIYLIDKCLIEISKLLWSLALVKSAYSDTLHFNLFLLYFYIETHCYFTKSFNISIWRNQYFS